MKNLAFESLVSSDSPLMAAQTARILKAFPVLRPPARPWSPRVAIKVKGKILFIHPNEVAAVEAQGNNVLLQRGESSDPDESSSAGESSYLLRESISLVAKKLEAHGFIRIHRSVLVNGLFVEEIIPQSTGEYTLRMKGGKEYTVTRTYKENLKILADFSIGAGKLFPDLEIQRPAPASIRMP